MLCERCKIREANIRYTEVINGVKSEHNLCSQCAQSTEIGQYAAIFDGDFPFNKLLSGILGMEYEDAAAGDVELGQVVCPVCHTSYSEFVKNSRFGCPDCYSVFDPLIGENIKKMQGSSSHTGKRPLRYEPEKSRSGSGKPELAELTDTEQLTLLNTKLKEAVREEDYESAAKYRDEIKSLKERIGTDE